MRLTRTLPRLCLLPLVVLLACGGAPDGGAGSALGGGASGSGGSQPPGFASMLEPKFDDLDGMKERRSIIMLTTFNRTGYFLDDGQPRGSVAEGARLFQEFVNKKVDMGRLNLDVVVVPVTISLFLHGWGVPR